MQPWLGTFVEIRAAGAEPVIVARAVEVAFVAIASVQALMSFHDVASDVSRLNREAWRTVVSVDPWTWTVLAEARRLSEISQGVFDITVADTLVAHGFLPQMAEQVGYAGGSWRDVELLPHAQVRFHRPLLIDLGGIAKGFAVDRAVDALRAGGATQGIVNAGGDLRVFGQSAQAIQVRNPSAPHRLAEMITLRDEAFATSAPYFAVRRHGRQRVSPLIDPRTRGSCTRTVSVSVRASACLHADALTKIVIADPEIARAVLAVYGAQALVLEAAPRRAKAVASGHRSPRHVGCRALAPGGV